MEAVFFLRIKRSIELL